MFRSLLCGKCCRNSAEDIRTIDYSHSLLREVPPDIFLCERTLEKLYLDSNHVVELPKQLFHCDELRTLNLSDNEIHFLPPAISSLINLYKLDISKNAITTLPDNIRNCSNLSTLDLSINPLEKLPESLINLVSLNELYLTDVFLEFLPANFGKLVNLRILELRENSLVTLPKTMNRLIHLQRLDIGNNEFSELPEVVSSLHNITELWIDGNHIRKLSPSIGQLRKMIHFEASNNNIEVLPRDIGYWTRIVEFSVSCNDISQLPTTIGNMKNLVGLKLDENNLKVLPDTIGKLTNLEELMLTHNYLAHLPSSIGLLRKLRVLTVDKNFLADIPPELGSCTSLSILSLRGNRMTDIPAEIGHLSSLRVLNLVDNLLRFLPMSVLKLDKLSALWLATNQSQPLVPLQQEMNPETYQAVLTCFMLPQVSHKMAVPFVQEEPRVFARQAHHKHICFASDAGVTIEQPGRLTRAPTPYPKELRALAKHAKNVQRGLTVSQHRQSDKIVQPIQGPVQIKEAKVTITPNNAAMGDCESPGDKNHARLQENDVDINHSITTEDTEQHIISEVSAISQPVLAYDSSPVIREAKNIRTDSQNNPLKSEMKVPPPYHIAAAYSTQAQFFNSIDNDAGVATSPALSQITNETYSLGLCEFNDAENNSDILHHTADEYKPRTFIQDKPILGENVVVPTPKRLSGPEKATKIPYLTSSPSPRRSPRFSRNESYEYPPQNTIPYSPRSCRRDVLREAQSDDLNASSNYNNNMNRKSSRTKIPAPASVPVPVPVSAKSPSNTSDSGSSKWVFGQHKNATVMQVTLNKNPDLGFTITENDGKGIYIDQVFREDMLKVGDKILEIEGVDFTKLSKNDALHMLNASGPTINMMISHMN